MKIPYDREKFRDSTGRRLTTGLFEETAQVSAVVPPFKLSDWHDTYMEVRDPSEYKAAMALVGDWDHWAYLRSNSVLKPIFDTWADELEAMLRSEALEALTALAKTPGGTAAAKWLAESQWKEKKAVGRPKKAKEEEPMDKDAEKVLKDATRLFAVK
jgi:hypothetical protein